MRTGSIKQFKVDVSYLTKEELLVLEKLIEAAKLIARVYEIQVKQGFYPKGATRKEIEKAAQKDPEIFSPYTVVERDQEGKLQAIPYHIKYHDLLLPVAQKLTEAADVALHNKHFKQALVIQAKALLDGNYDKAQISWLKVKPTIVDIVIGPIERIEDNIFFIKRSYQAWVGIMNKNITHRLNILKDVVFSATRRQILPSERVDFMKKAKIRVDDTIIFSGMIANYNFTATTLPNDINLLEEYGSEAWIFIPSVKENFHKRQMLIFNSIFAPSFRGSFSQDLIFRGYLLMIAMHEIARVAVRFRFAVDRLKELYPIFNEITIESLALKMTGSLLLKDVISQKEMEAALVMFLVRMFDGYAEKMKNKSGSEPFVAGNAILLNSLIDSGALIVSKEGISWPNFTKMFIAVSSLADQMEKVIAEGSYADARHYLKKHVSLSVFKQFKLKF